MRDGKALRSVIFVGAMTLGIAALAAPKARAQAVACRDEESMAQSMVQDVAASVDTIKKESESDFESKYHQKALTNKLTFATTAVDSAVQCLDKATGDSTAAARKDADSKLKTKLTGYRTELKAKTDPKEAKAYVATFDLSAAAVVASK